MAFIIPCFDSYNIIIRVERIIIVINQNHTLSLFFHFFEKKQYLRIVPSDSRKVFRHDYIYGAEIGHHVLKLGTVEGITGNAVVLVDMAYNHIVFFCVFLDNQFLVFDRGIISLIIVSGEAHITVYHCGSMDCCHHKNRPPYLAFSLYFTMSAGNQARME